MYFSFQTSFIPATVDRCSDGDGKMVESFFDKGEDNNLMKTGHGGMMADKAASTSGERMNFQNRDLNGNRTAKRINDKRDLSRWLR